jgi:hypothetical protein
MHTREDHFLGEGARNHKGTGRVQHLDEKERLGRQQLMYNNAKTLPSLSPFDDEMGAIRNS